MSMAWEAVDAVRLTLRRRPRAWGCVPRIFRFFRATCYADYYAWRCLWLIARLGSRLRFGLGFGLELFFLFLLLFPLLLLLFLSFGHVYADAKERIDKRMSVNRQQCESKCTWRSTMADFVDINQIINEALDEASQAYSRINVSQNRYFNTRKSFQ